MLQDIWCGHEQYLAACQVRKVVLLSSFILLNFLLLETCFGCLLCAVAQVHICSLHRCACKTLWGGGLCFVMHLCIERFSACNIIFSDLSEVVFAVLTCFSMQGRALEFSRGACMPPCEAVLPACLNLRQSGLHSSM